jgi:hypothetical protein
LCTSHLGFDFLYLFHQAHFFDNYSLLKRRETRIGWDLLVGGGDLQGL